MPIGQLLDHPLPPLCKQVQAKYRQNGCLLLYSISFKGACAVITWLVLLCTQ